MSEDSKTRFSSRVQNYVKYRPTYPAGVLSILDRELHIAAPWIVADVGAGTGISSQLFLSAGHVVYAVEPNDDMRQAAEKMLGANPRFHAIAGSGEATTLESRSANLIVCAQAFHWFDHAAAKCEFERILRSEGMVLLMWNKRRTDATEFLREYEKLLKEVSPDYSEVRHERVGTEHLDAFFAPHGYRKFTLPNVQYFDYAGLEGRLLSSSYAPLAGDPRHETMLRRLREIFDRHQTNAKVAFEYHTELFLGRV
jgi:SAM-dependent methyltransferase